MKEQVILVDLHDHERGAMDKQEAHTKAALHRAFSVFIFNGKGELLLQRRAAGKYHSAGLWSNTCCSHPAPGERTDDATVRRLKQEMGISCFLRKAFSFAYQLPVGENIFEHEFDHVYVGRWDKDPAPDKSEVMEWKWMSTDAIAKELETNATAYTMWFQLIFKDAVRSMQENK